MLGLLAGILALGLIQALTFLGVGWVFGAGFEAGIAGMATIVLLSLLISLGFGCIGAFVALRAGNGEAVRGCSRCSSPRSSCHRCRCRAT